MIIAIDGPSASGKSSLSRELGIRLDYKFISSGYLYRIITYVAQNFTGNEYDFISEEKLMSLVSQNKITFNGVVFLLNEENITNEILNDKIDLQVSFYSSYKSIRDFANKKLREIVKFNNDDYIIEGRDITTVVFPNAECKIYLDAPVKIRALRRYKQRSGTESLEKLEKSIEARDIKDKNKEYGKLRIDKNVFYLDTGDKDIDEICNVIIKKFGLKK